MPITITRMISYCEATAMNCSVEKYSGTFN